MKIIDEFKKFAIKGNVVDMGVGIIIGGAFGTVVSSFVNDLVMPPIGLLTGGINFANKSWILKPATETTKAVTLNYGLFINNLLTFLIVAVAIFVVIKWMNKLREAFEKGEVQSTQPAKIPDDIKLLTEIRDELRNK